jgi:predicted ATPase/DNA-binding SARP family transcriptional activator
MARSGRGGDCGEGGAQAPACRDLPEFRLLGPLEVTTGGQAVPLGGAKQRALLTYLLLHANELIPSERIEAVLWSEARPPSARKMLQMLAAQLRTLLPPGDEGTHLVTGPTGLMMRLRPEQLDLHAFEQLLNAAREAAAAGEFADAAHTLRLALRLWRGAPLADSHESFAKRERARLRDLRLAAGSELVDVELARGRHVAVIPDLLALATEFPLSERLRGQLMLALYRSGRQAEALSVYSETRELLVEQFGIEPARELRHLHQAILRHDGRLDRPPRLHRYRVRVPATPLVGRSAEVADVCELLRRNDVRLLTLAGVAGVGKTRVALAAAEALAPEFEDGAFVIGLETITKPDDVAAQVAAAVDIPHRTNPAMSLCSHLRGRSLLLVLDSFEHLLGTAPLLIDILADAPAAKVLVSSRTLLHISGERVHTLSPLPVPPVDETDPDRLLRNPAVELFTVRATAIGHDLTADDDAVAAIAGICQRLEGLPLSIELAAARANLLPPRALLDRLGSRLDLLTLGSRDAPPRHQSLRATLDWSWKLLTATEQQLLAELSVFTPGWTLADAEAVCSLGRDVLAGLTSLVHHSLVRQVGTSETRFAMLETIREYAMHQLRSTGYDQEALHRHARRLGPV